MTTRTLPKTGKRQTLKLKYLTITGLMAAMITIMTAYICHIPTGINGGYIHFGDSLIYLAAAILPTPYALAAAAVGGGIADLLTSPMWVPATVVIKIAIALPFTSRHAKIVTPHNVAASVIACLISGFGYFLAEYLLFGTMPALIASLSGSLVQSGGSAAFFVVFGLALDRTHAKSRLLSAV